MMKMKARQSTPMPATPAPDAKVFESLPDEIRAVLAHATRPLSTPELMSACMTADSVTAVSGSVNRMWLAGELVRTINDANRFAYVLNQDFKPSPHGKCRPGPVLAVTPHAAIATPAVPEVPKVPEVMPTVVVGSYSLYDHISHALADCDDLLGDAIDHGASGAVTKCLLAGAAGLRRAQEAIVREQRA